MSEKSYLACDRGGLVHVAITSQWRFMLDWNEVGAPAEEAVEETLCEEKNYFDEVFDVQVTCVACVARLWVHEDHGLLEWRKPGDPR